jgi:hypothetical protein
VKPPSWIATLRDTCSDRQIAEAVIAALLKFLERDHYLLGVDVAERAIAHRLAVHLHAHFPEWNVDCEYNRDGHDPKEIPDGSGDDGEHGSRVYPDIIVHHRGTNDNHIVVELKKSSNPQPDDRDFHKLAGYRAVLGYRHALFVRLAVGNPGIQRACFV